MHRRPCALVFRGDDVQQAFNDAVFHRRKIAALDGIVKAPVAAKQVIHSGKNQRGFQHHHAQSGQRPDMHDIHIGWRFQIIQELVVFFYARR